MPYRIEVRLQIKVDDSGFPPDNCFGYPVHRRMSSPLGPVPIRPVLKIRFENWFQDELHRSLDNPVPNVGYPKSSDLPISLGYLLLPVPGRSIRALD